MINPIHLNKPLAWNNPMRNIKKLMERDFQDRKNIAEIYRESASYDEFMEKAILEGYDREEADCLYHEIEFKYTH